MKLDKSIGFLGAGNMAEALIRGLLRGHAEASQIGASGPRSERMSELSERYGIFTSTDNNALVERSEIVVLAVKPQIMRKVLDEIADRVRPDALIISIAAGIPVAAIEQRLRPLTRVIRSMPNTPALVDAAATAISAGGHATAADLDVAKRIFDAVGVTVILDEYQLDAVTGLSGSGPAYIFLILEALSDAGVKVGLSRRTSQLLAAQTVLGSAKLLLETNEHPGRLKDMVTSPGGTAITGLHTLEHGGVRTTLIDAVEAATKRSHELGQALLKSVDQVNLREDAAGITFDVLVTPRASREKLGPVLGDRLKISVTAPPVEGEANAAVIALVARSLRVPRAAVSIVAGEGSRRKTVRVAGVRRAVLDPVLA